MKKLLFFAVICFFLFLSEPMLVQAIPQAVPGNRIELRYPVVLVHGIARTDRGRHEETWGRIPQVLRENGIEVYFGNTDAWGDISSNAELLKATIDSILERTSLERVNIIAHSKGGLDSRYLIWKYEYGDRIASLTTISTPHGGSEIADFVYHSGLLHSESARRGLLTLGRIFGDVNLDIFTVNQNLTTANMREFNATVKKDERVFYQVFYSVMNEPNDDPVYSLSYAFLRNIAGENDGLVSARSASWGNNPVRLPLNLSHRQMTDQGTEGFPDMLISYIYLDIVRGLAGRGF